MTVSFFGRAFAPSSLAGRLVLFVGFPVIAVLLCYSAYLSVMAISAETNVHAMLVFVVLFCLTLEVTVYGRKVGLLPGKYTRELLGWACFGVSLYHYILLDMKVEVAVVVSCAFVHLAGQFVKLIQAQRQEQWHLKRAVQAEMVDLKYGDRSSK